ncbi:DUF4034 domain-containing protein [Pseudomonas sp. Teo4]|uniref:DUF4034 domain-containing protein n=1 Tax=Pseudomonas sp. Teo4 TaxID=3064528 RepID=UPI002ABB462D|nr:DUF4034 domain-containing protein [Pseudomonas sp. Teo4]MDZ3994372.1 hypothetical protein [Pseudomonas sp. Teo4]
MQTLTRTRQDIRELVQANAFVELNGYFDALEACWLQAPPGECPTYLEALQGHMLANSGAQGDKALTQFLKAWIDACPKAYHPQVAMGFHCFSRARHIQGVDSTDEVSEERWLAAEQVCEIGAVYLLRAMAVSKVPVAAAICMLHMSAHFREPGWLSELLHGQPARYRPSAHPDVEVQEAAAPFLVRYGFAPLLELPQLLPSCLTVRSACWDETAQHYWLGHALRWFAGCFEAVEAYATYLLPRWGGGLQALEDLVSGPACEGWSEAQRNAIRWTFFFDGYRADQNRENDRWQGIFNNWWLRELRPRERAMLLARRGAWRRQALHDPAGAMADFVASVELCPEHCFSRGGAEPFYNFVCLVVLHGLQDNRQSLRIAIESLCDSRMLTAACALRAVGHQFGLWGFARSFEQASGWLDAAVNRQFGNEGQGFDILEVPRLLWAGQLHEPACFLFEQCAERRLPEAAMRLCDLHRGGLDDTPECYLDDEAAEHWLMRAAALGSPQATYEVAFRRMMGEDLSERSAMLSVRRLLLEALGHDQTDAQARLQLGILLRQFGESAEREEAVSYLLDLVQHEDAGIAGRACAQMALAWMQGHGTRKQSRFAAIEWVSRAAALLPGNPEVEEIQSAILNSHSVFKTLFTVCGATLFRGTLYPDELPPTAAAPSRDRLRASA